MCDYSDLQNNNNEDNNIFNSIDFDDLDIAFLDGFFDPQTPPPIPYSPSPSPCLAEIEQLLMNDDYTTNDNDNDNDETFIIDDFLVDCPLDVPLDNNNCGGDVFESNPESNLSDNGEKIDLFDAVGVCESGGEVGVSNEVESNPDSNVSDNGESEKDKCDAFASNGDEDDALRKKRRRQIRNRDSALKSRERRKMYVTDLEAKSKYFEAECIRLQRVLQGCVAENHALHLQLQKDNAVRVFMAKQESAVLLIPAVGFPALAHGNNPVHSTAAAPPNLASKHAGKRGKRQSGSRPSKRSKKWIVFRNFAELKIFSVPSCHSTYSAKEFPEFIDRKSKLPIISSKLQLYDKQELRADSNKYTVTPSEAVPNEIPKTTQKQNHWKQVMLNTGDALRSPRNSEIRI
ncbi:hypothetical protein GIB67_033759 [Kingdonia uniflora]|uniref:BZIP domain-containing protein n=1 Tax=Kingdonia uniflora TaxID=39325 RepID=A0A7J7P447_9MAGN|nr:hypothetical protein GIB67_033759 [Kingdonia uniflora]